MLESRQLEELAGRLARVLPPSLRGLRSELEDNFRAVLRANLDRLELVSRERFDVQAELLARTQARLAALEQRLKALEAAETSVSSRQAAKDAKEIE
jgi:BMFP domain-containing protein YqiC